MKKIFDMRVYIKKQGWKEYVNTSVWKHLIYTENDGKGKSFLFNSFSDFLDEVEKGWIYNVERKETFFGHLPKIEFSKFENRFSMNEKNFVPVEVKIVFEPVEEVSLKNLFEMLSADEFCEYLKDRGISFCPMQNIRM